MSLGTVLVWLVLGLLVYLLMRQGKKMPVIFSHWHHLLENLQVSTKEFYASVEEAVKTRQLPDTKLSRVDHHEGGVLTAKREYLRVDRKEHTFDICAAPFGRGFFVSWWLGETMSPLVNMIFKIPLIGPWLIRVFRPQTYYRMDTALMFQESVHASVLEVLDQRTKAQGVRSLSESERKPIMTDLFKR